MVPRDAESIESWEEYFYKNKNKFYLLMLLLLLNIQVSGYFLMGLNPFKISHLPALLAVIPLVIALRSNKHIVHLSMMILFIVQVIIMMSTIAAEPGWLINR
ncbi:MAG: hypothetical protein R8G66_03145 [Cytophagales bacterium]|nr:hypothetical protein [Cytophagales bacterium]